MAASARSKKRPRSRTQVSDGPPILGAQNLLAAGDGDHDRALFDRPQAATHVSGVFDPAEPAYKQDFGGLQDSLIQLPQEAVQIEARRRRLAADVKRSDCRQGLDLVPLQDMPEIAEAGMKLPGFDGIARQVFAEQILESLDHLAAHGIED